MASSDAHPSHHSRLFNASLLAIGMEAFDYHLRSVRGRDLGERIFIGPIYEVPVGLRQMLHSAMYYFCISAYSSGPLPRFLGNEMKQKKELRDGTVGFHSTLLLSQHKLGLSP